MERSEILKNYMNSILCFYNFNIQNISYCVPKILLYLYLATTKMSINVKLAKQETYTQFLDGDTSTCYILTLSRLFKQSGKIF